MENGDEWLALDKFQHVLFCFSIALICSLLCARSGYPFLRRRHVWVGSVISLAAGTAKEIADEFGFFRSAGASVKDAVADLLGVILAAVCVLSFCRRNRSCQPMEEPQVLGLQIV